MITKTKMLQILKKEIAESKIALKHLLTSFYLGSRIVHINEIVQKSHNKNYYYIPDKIDSSLFNNQDFSIINEYYTKIVEQIKTNYRCINKIHRYCKNIK